MSGALDSGHPHFSRKRPRRCPEGDYALESIAHPSLPDTGVRSTSKFPIHQGGTHFSGHVTCLTNARRFEY